MLLLDRYQHTKTNVGNVGSAVKSTSINTGSFTTRNDINRLPRFESKPIVKKLVWFTNLLSDEVSSLETSNSVYIASVSGRSCVFW